METIGSGLSLFAILGFVAFLIWHGDQSKRERRQQRLAERERLFAQIGPGEALASFLQTEEGKKMIAELNEPERKPGGGNLRMSVIGLLTSGVITLAVGAGFFYAAPRVPNDTLLVPGGIIGGIGVGCLVAALIHYVLGKAWGLLKPEEENESPRRRLE